jgi:probable rRNA maturation factor
VIEADVFVESPSDWGDVEAWTDLIARICTQTIHKTPFAELIDSPALIDLSVRLTDDATVQALNLDARGINKPTNVLSFQFLDRNDLCRLAGKPAATLGDMALAHETIRQEAKAQGKRFEDHATHLVVHGLLHMLGYDHQEDAQADTMETLERDILAGLGLADPYADPTFRAPD